MRATCFCRDLKYNLFNFQDLHSPLSAPRLLSTLKTTLRKLPLCEKDREREWTRISKKNASFTFLLLKTKKRLQAIEIVRTTFMLIFIPQFFSVDVSLWLNFQLGKNAVVVIFIVKLLFIWQKKKNNDTNPHNTYEKLHSRRMQVNAWRNHFHHHLLLFL